MMVPPWAWALTAGLFAVLIAADLALARGARDGLRGAGLLSLLWVAAGLGFGALLWWWHGTKVGGRFLVRTGGTTMITPLLVALIAVEVTDLVFAMDSIPAIFGITGNVFIVFTSNAFAVFGLRALYFVLAGSMHRFRYLRHAVAVLLAFTGTKMLLTPWVHLPVSVSLAVILTVIGGAVGASLWHDRASPCAEAVQESRQADEVRTAARS